MGKRGLGKGLGAIIPELTAAPEGALCDLDIESIRPNPRQPRQRWDEEKLRELADSIREHGVVQPIIVRQRDDGYELVAGERRWRAARLAGLKTVPAVIRELSEAELTVVSLIENIQREDLNPMEEARAYHRLVTEFGLTQEVLAKRVGKSRSQVANVLRLLSLDRRTQALVEEGKLSFGHARALLAIEEEKRRQQLADRIVKQGLSVREAESAVSEKSRRPKRRDRPVMDPNVAEVEERLRRVLATDVRIKQGRKKGIIEIDYFGLEDLDRILEIICLKQ
ncbi:MAG: ParB/RepB/Spo0J family partition protein [Bacillota bacterium]